MKTFKGREKLYISEVEQYKLMAQRGSYLWKLSSISLQHMSLRNKREKQEVTESRRRQAEPRADCSQQLVRTCLTKQR